jgi:hypothetical protein
MIALKIGPIASHDLSLSFCSSSCGRPGRAPARRHGVDMHLDLGWCFSLVRSGETSASDAARANSLGALFVKSFQQVLRAWLIKSFRACKTLVISVCRGRLSPVCYPSQNVSMASCSACSLTNPSAAAAALRPFVLPIGAALPVAPPYIVHHRIFSRTASNWHGFPADLRLAGALPTVSDAHTAAVGPMLPLRRCMAWKGSELAGRLSDETRSALEHRMNAKGAIVPSKECRRQGGDIAGIGVRLFCPHPRRPWHRLNEPSLGVHHKCHDTAQEQERDRHNEGQYPASG